MKRILPTLTVVLMFAATASAQHAAAQPQTRQVPTATRNNMPASPATTGWTDASQQPQYRHAVSYGDDSRNRCCKDADTVLISQRREGDNIVKHYWVKHPSGQKASFDVHYVINLSDISPSFGDNSSELSGLTRFVGRTSDSLMHVDHIMVVGYASPDGNERSNAALAAKRAAALQRYAEKECCCTGGKISASSHACTWRDCIPAVQTSDIPERGEVLRILSGNMPESDKEVKLKKMAASWEYMKRNILPAMRRADITFDYGQDAVFVHTVAVPVATAPQTVQQPRQPQEPPYVVVQEDETGIIIEVPHDGRERRRNRRYRDGYRDGGRSGYYN